MRSTRTRRQRRRIAYENAVKAGKPGYRRSRKQFRKELSKKTSPAERVFAKLIGVQGNIAGKQSARTEFGRVHLQFPILEYFADFCFLQPRLVVEIDGAQHQRPERIEYDRRRDQRMQEIGWRVLRISARKVFFERDAVLDLLRSHLFPVTVTGV